VRLGAPIRGVVYGLALIVGAPITWQAGQQKAAVFIGAVAIFGIGLEAVRSSQR
jgi:hypothetical protein